MTSASLLVVLIVGTIVGALVGLVIGHGINPLYLSILAGFLGAVLASIARNIVIAWGAGEGPDTSRTPALVIVYAAVASLAGSALGMEIARMSGLETSPVWIGALAGLFSVILTAMLMITYHAYPGEQPMLRSKPRV
jgi:hypothetical protein